MLAPESWFLSNILPACAMRNGLIRSIYIPHLRAEDAIGLMLLGFEYGQSDVLLLANTMYNGRLLLQALAKRLKSKGVVLLVHRVTHIVFTYNGRYCEVNITAWGNEAMRGYSFDSIYAWQLGKEKTDIWDRYMLCKA